MAYLGRGSPDIVVIVDSDGVIQFINHTVSGLTAEEVVGRTVYDFIQPEYHDLHMSRFAQVFRGEPADLIESRATGPDGSVSWYRTRFGPVKHAGQR